MKPGQVQVVSFNHLGDFSRAVNIGKVMTPGSFTMVPGGKGCDYLTRSLKVRRMGATKGGNVKNANWRHPHGGAWVSPRSKRRVPSKGR